MARTCTWRVEEKGDETISMWGNWLARKMGVRTGTEIRLVIGSLRDRSLIRFDASHLGARDADLKAFIRALEDQVCRLQPISSEA